MSRKTKLSDLTLRDIERLEREQFSREFEERERRELAAERRDPPADTDGVPF